MVAAALALDDRTDRHEQPSFDHDTQQVLPSQSDPVAREGFLNDRGIRVVHQPRPRWRAWISGLGEPLLPRHVRAPDVVDVEQVEVGELGRARVRAQTEFVRKTLRRERSDRFAEQHRRLPPGPTPGAWHDGHVPFARIQLYRRGDRSASCCGGDPHLDHELSDRFFNTDDYTEMLAADDLAKFQLPPVPKLTEHQRALVG